MKNTISTSVNRGRRNVIQRVALAFVGGCLALFIGEGLLAVAGFPTVLSPRIAHPPRIEEIRKSPDFQYVFRTNSEGLREREIPVVNTTGAIRVFVSGDSFTEGVGVAAEQRFSRILERTFSRPERRVTFINGGLAGAGLVEYGRLFVNIGLKYTPNVLLVCIYPNDVANSPEQVASLRLDGAYQPEGTIKRLLYHLVPRSCTLARRVRSEIAYRRKTRTTDFIATISRQARLRGIPQETIQAWQASIPGGYVQAVNRGEMNGAPLSFGLLYPEYWTDSFDVTGPRAERKYANVATLLSELRRVAANHDVKVGLVYIPSSFQYIPSTHDATNPWKIGGATLRRDWLYGRSELQERLYAWAGENAVPFLDLTPVFRSAAEKGQQTNWAIDGHWNPLGHEIAAQAIASWIEARGILEEGSRQVTPADQ